MIEDIKAIENSEAFNALAARVEALEKRQQETDHRVDKLLPTLKDVQDIYAQYKQPAASGGPQREQYPIPLNEAQEATIKQWASDDRLWTTRETVEFNLTTFARCILRDYKPPPREADAGQEERLWSPCERAKCELCGEWTWMSYNAVPMHFGCIPNPQHQKAPPPPAATERQEQDGSGYDAWMEWSNSNPYGSKLEAFYGGRDSVQQLAAGRESQWREARELHPMKPGRYPVLKETIPRSKELIVDAVEFGPHGWASTNPVRYWLPLPPIPKGEAEPDYRAIANAIVRTPHAPQTKETPAP